jgi:protein required for attachment to host cells
MSMATTWIIAADASRARILQVAGREHLVEVEDLVNPEGRLHNQEINTDAKGRFRGPDRPGGHSSDDEERTVDHYNELFAKRVAGYLDKARTDGRYDQLVLVAAPKVLGMMRKQLGKEVEKCVVDELDKDLSWFNARDLQLYLSDFAKGSGRAP